MALGVPAVLGTPVSTFTATPVSSFNYTGLNPTAGRVITVVASARKADASNPAATLNVSMSGAGAWSWTSEQQTGSTGFRHTTAVFRALVPASPGTGLTLTISSDVPVDRRKAIVTEQSGADPAFYNVAKGTSTSATPSLTLPAAPASASYKLGVITSVGDSDGVAPGATAAMTELAEVGSSSVGAMLQVQYRTGVTTTAVDWQGCNTSHNQMIAWEVKEASAGTKTIKAVVSVDGDTAITAESAALTAGKRYIVALRLDQANNVLGLTVDGGTEVTTSLGGGTLNAQQALRIFGARIADGAPQSDSTTASMLYAEGYGAVLTGDDLTKAIGDAVKVLAPIWTPPGSVTVNKTGTTNVSLVAYVQDPSGDGWSVGSVAAVGASAAIGSDNKSIDVSSVTAQVGGTVSLTIRLDNAKPVAVRGMTTVGMQLGVVSAAPGVGGWPGPLSKLPWHSGGFNRMLNLHQLRTNPANNKTRRLDVATMFYRRGGWVNGGANAVATFKTWPAWDWMMDDDTPVITIAYNPFPSDPKFNPNYDEDNPRAIPNAGILSTWPSKGTIPLSAWVSPNHPVGYQQSGLSNDEKRARHMDVWQHLIDGHFDHIIENQITAFWNGIKNDVGSSRTVIWRLFWESTGAGNYNVNGGGLWGDVGAIRTASALGGMRNAADLALIQSAFGYVNDLIRAINPTQFKFHWSPLRSTIAASTIWKDEPNTYGSTIDWIIPTDWDFIGPDFYDRVNGNLVPPPNGNSTYEIRWNTMDGQGTNTAPNGISKWFHWVRNVARSSHPQANPNVLFGVAEWAVWEWNALHEPKQNGGDDPYYIDKMYDQFDANNDIMGYEAYYNNTSGYNTKFTEYTLIAPGSISIHPNASAMYRTKWATLV